MQQLILVSGPGRSGTSATTRVIAALGAGLGEDLLPGDRFNPVGYFEDRLVVAEHRNLLNALGLIEPFGLTLPLPPEWLAQPAARLAADRLCAHVAPLFGAHERVVLKDPRSSMVLPLWREIAARLGAELRIVLCIRQPAAMAASYHAASGVSNVVGEAIWLMRMVRALQDLGDDGLILDFDQLVGDTRGSIQALCDYLLAPGPCPPGLVDRLTAASLVDASLRHAPDSLAVHHAAALEIFEGARLAPRGGPARASLVARCAEFARQVDAMYGWNEACRAALLRHSERTQTLARRRATARGTINELRGELRRTKLAMNDVPRLHPTLERGAERALVEEFNRLARIGGTKDKAPAKTARSALAARPGQLGRALRFAARVKRGVWRRLRLDAPVRQPSAAQVAPHPQMAARSAREWSAQARLARAARPAAVERFAHLEHDSGLLGGSRLDILAPHGRRPSACQVLFLGPTGFRPGVWSTRADYIFPDLIEPLPDPEKIVFVTGRIPDWAMEDARRLVRSYGITMHQVASGVTRPRWMRPEDFWTSIAVAAAVRYRPRLITNAFGGIMFGYASSYAARLVGARSLLRAAGDEITSRIHLGVYAAGSREHQHDLLMENVAVNDVDRVIVMAEHERARLAAHCDEDSAAKIVVCMRGVDTERFAWKARAPLRGRVLFVGRKSLEKGYQLAEAVALLAEAQNLPYSFHFAGTFEPGREGNREFLGFVDSQDLSALYHDHDILINTSLTEGMPQVICEALSTGMPCVVPHEIFADDWGADSGVISVPRDAPAFLAALRSALDDPARYARLAEQARATATTKLERNHWSGVYRDLVRDLVE